MKRRILILFGLLCASLINAQVGINIKDSRYFFHIDAKNNTGNTGTTNIEDDLIINETGVGIAMIPSRGLSVKGLMRISDGTEGFQKLFTTDGTGKGFWDETFKFTVINEPVRTGVNLSSAWQTISQNNLTLTSGIWMVMSRVETTVNKSTTYYTWSQIMITPSSGSAYSINAGGQRPMITSPYNCMVNVTATVQVPTGQTWRASLQALNYAKVDPADGSVYATTLNGFFYAVRISQ